METFPASYNMIRWNKTEEKSCMREINKDPTTNGMMKTLLKLQYAPMRMLSLIYTQGQKMNARDDQMVEVITSLVIMNKRVDNIELALIELKDLLTNIPAGAGPADAGLMTFELPVNSSL